MPQSEKRTLNPATAKLKSDKAAFKAKQLKERTRQRQEKYARQDPDRIQKRIDDIRQHEQVTGTLSVNDRNTVEKLEKEIKLVSKAWKAKGLAVTETSGRKKSDSHQHQFTRVSQQASMNDESDSGESTSSSVSSIPMPLDTLLGQRFPPGWQQRESLLPESRPETKTQATTYEAAPVLRDLKKEVALLVPSAVKRQRTS